MKSIATSILLLASALLHAGEGPWFDDLAAAQKQAASEKKPIFLLFTGSEWSGPCIEMEREVFSQDAFKEAMTKKLVLAKIDLPQDESTMPDEKLHQANLLQESYRVDGYPTVILTDPEGRPFATTGYLDGDAMKYVSHLNTLLAQKGAFDGMLAEAATLEGLDKAKKLAEALKSLDLPDYFLIDFYPETIAEIDRNDPGQTLPYLKTLKAAQRFYEMENRIEFLIEEGEMEEVFKLVEKGIKDESFSIDQRQRMHFFKAIVHMEAERYDEALTSLEDCRKLDPKSEMAQSLGVLKSHIEGLQKEGPVIVEPVEGDEEEDNAFPEEP